MNLPAITAIAQALLAGDKGLIAIDESPATCNRRFAETGIPQIPENRQAWRELIVTTPGLAEAISGAILHDETIRQRASGGRLIVDLLVEAGIVPGIKVDLGAHSLAGHPGELVSEGLDGLGGRLRDYFGMGARFAKWRAVIALAGHFPSRGCIEANAHALARFAALCQEAGLVPVVEPEILMGGDHSLSRSGDVTEALLRAVFEQLAAQGVALEAMILKPGMVTAGLKHAVQPSIAAVAEATVASLLRVVPAAVPGVAFLSGGQSPSLASSRLNAMNRSGRGGGAALPWALTFSFARAIQQPALEVWKGSADNVAAAQQVLLHRARLNRAARRGDYTSTMEAA